MSIVTGSSRDPRVRGAVAAPSSAEDPEQVEWSALATLLERPRYEVLPLPGTADQVGAEVPRTVSVTVTASPRRGLEPTLGLTEELARGGYSAVPHLAARMVSDERHLAEILARLDEAGVRDAFVVAGDGEEPVGDFFDSLELLAAIERLHRSGAGRRPESIGVSGYPEGHPHIGADELDRALLAKQPLSSYVVTQMCFDPDALLGWITHARELGVLLPVQVGIAGAVDRTRLLRIAARIGVGTSLRFLRKHHGGTRLLRPGGYRPDRLLEELVSGRSPAAPVVAGLHVYTLGDVAATERWRREVLDALAEGHAHG